MEVFPGAIFRNYIFLIRMGTLWVIDQVGGKDGWILAEFFFFCVFMDRDEVEVHKHAKNERGQYQAILSEQAFGEIFLAGQGG